MPLKRVRRDTRMVIDALRVSRRFFVYSERRKFKSSCFWLGLRLLNWLITRLASEPELAWAWMALSRPPFVGPERPSWRKKMRWPTPQSGAVRNSSGPAEPWETLSARPEPMW